MRRRLFNFLSAVSLLLCVATYVLWGRSFDRAYIHKEQVGASYHEFTSKNGDLCWIRSDGVRVERPGDHPNLWPDNLDKPSPYPAHFISYANGGDYTFVEGRLITSEPSLLSLVTDRPLADSTNHRFGIWLIRGRVHQFMTFRVLALSYAIPMVGLAVLPLMWTLSFFTRKYRREYRAWIAATRRCCASCGYDLRATLTRCPECGTVPARTGVRAKHPATSN